MVTNKRDVLLLIYEYEHYESSKSIRGFATLPPNSLFFHYQCKHHHFLSRVKQCSVMNNILLFFSLPVNLSLLLRRFSMFSFFCILYVCNLSWAVSQVWYLDRVYLQEFKMYSLQTIEFPGMQFGAGLKWTDNIQLTSRLNKLLVINIFIKFTPNTFLKMVYYEYFQSILTEYNMVYCFGRCYKNLL